MLRRLLALATFSGQGIYKKTQILSHLLVPRQTPLAAEHSISAYARYTSLYPSSDGFTPSICQQLGELLLFEIGTGGRIEEWSVERPLYSLLALHDERHACLCGGWRILVALLRTAAKISGTPLQGKDTRMPRKSRL